MEKATFVSREKLMEIAEKYPTPFHLYDEKGIRENARKLNKAFSWNKGFKEYFAVKATPNPTIVSILAEEGCGADCSSFTELMIAEAVGITDAGIMFSANAMPAEDFRYASELGSMINFDDITHIDFLEQIIGRLPATVCCRYNPGGVFELGNTIMDMPADAKFGMTRPQLAEACRILTGKGVSEIGIHSFLASNTTTNGYYPKLARDLFEVAVDMRNETGANITFINLSGGIGVPYRPGQKPINIDTVAQGVRKAFDEILVPAGMGNISIFTELGRYMTAPFGCLVTKAIHRKDTYKHYIGVDASACDLMRPAMYGAYHHITVAGKEDAPADHVYDITGSLCENNDKFAIDRALPKIDTGDLLVIHDTGAHGHSMGYNYNGRLRSAEILLREDGSFEMIRRAETPRDYFATLDFMGKFK